MVTWWRFFTCFASSTERSESLFSTQDVLWKANQAHSALSIGNARLAGLEKDLKLVGHDFDIILTCFNVSHVLLELPANLLTKKFGPGRMLPFYVSTTERIQCLSG